MKERNPRVRAILLGYPKSGKTGALAALVNSGRFEVGILDFDHNPDPLYAFVKPAFFPKVSIITLEDKLRDTGKKIGLSGEPVAFRDALRALDHWVDDEGRDWGAVKDWGPDRVLVMDSLTSMGEAALRRRRYTRNSGPTGDDTDVDWGSAMRDQAYMMEMLASPRFSCHVLALSHIKLVEPKLLRETRNDSEDVKRAKAEISRMRAESIEIRKCPSALGNALPPEIARYFPAVLLVDGNRGGGRKIITSGEEGVDLGVPATHIGRTLPLETGLLSVFDAILNTEKE